MAVGVIPGCACRRLWPTCFLREQIFGLMPLRKRQKKMLLALGFGLFGLALIWFLFPFWFPWILRPLAGWQGASFGKYERLDYRRFALHNVVYTNANVTVRVDHAAGL